MEGIGVLDEVYCASPWATILVATGDAIHPSRPGTVRAEGLQQALLFHLCLLIQHQVEHKSEDQATGASNVRG